MDDKLIKDSLNSAKIIAMVGVSSIKNENTSNIVRRPSIIVMNYLQEFGYKVIPVNPFSVGKKINGEMVVEKLEDIDGIWLSFFKFKSRKSRIICTILTCLTTNANDCELFFVFDVSR